MEPTMNSNFQGLLLRKWYEMAEEALAGETGKLADGAPLRKITVAVAVHNPYAGRYSDALDALVTPSVALGEEFGRRIGRLAAGDAVESYGKACLVGANGEYEHGNALLTSAFADPIRMALGGGKSWIPSTGKVGGPGTPIDVPLAHRNALYVRSHYDTLTVAFGDAPRPDEIVAIFSVATRGRLHARLGGLKASDVQGKDGLR
jgi:hypothetical protein